MFLKWTFKMAIVIVLFLLPAFFINCSTIGFNKPASVCDDLPGGASWLCDKAKALDLNLEITGEVFAALNYDAITSGAYTKAQAISGIEKLRSLGHLAAGRIDVSDLGYQASNLISKYRTLRLGSKVILIYLSQYGRGVYFTPQDVVWWDYWCDSLIADVNSL